MPWDPILKKNLLKFVVVVPVNIARDLHKKRSRQRKRKRVYIQTNTNNLLLHLFFFFQLLFFMFLLNHVFHSVLTFLFLTVPLDYFSQTQILHIFFSSALNRDELQAAACAVVNRVANHKFIWIQNVRSELIINKQKKTNDDQVLYLGGN